jgi:type IV pilus assembly protein PilE
MRTALPPRTLRALQQGFSLIDLLIACCLAGILAAVSWPSLAAHSQRSQRADAILALTRVQLAQERFHAGTGFYAADSSTLRLPTRSEQGHYDLVVVGAGDRYHATATARPGSAQSADTSCLQLSVSAERGFVSTGPNGQCWNR